MVIAEKKNFFWQVKFETLKIQEIPEGRYFRREKMAQKREHWGGMIGFILATAGAAIGLGNIWKFPYVTGMNGGGAFVLVYLVCILFLGMPIMLSEIAMGRQTGKNPVGAFRALQPDRSKLAAFLGFGLLAFAILIAFRGEYGFAVISALMGGAFLRWGFRVAGLVSILVGMAIFSYYAVVGGWALAYTCLAFCNKLNYTDLASAEAAFGAFIESPGKMILFQMLFMVLVGLVTLGGVRGGIERCNKILMPVLLFLLLAVIVRSISLEGSMAGVAFFLKPDFSKLTAVGLLEALGHAFFTLSLGMAITVTYGSYMKRDKNLFLASFWVIVLDTFAAVLAGLAIFPAVFAMGFKADAGPSLIFQVLPATFNNFPGELGYVWAGFFFLMLTIAALTSGVALLEIGTALLIDEFKWKRVPAVLFCFVAIALLGILSSVSIDSWNQIPQVKAMIAYCFGEHHVMGSWFETLDHISSNWILPLSGLVISLFVGYVWTTRAAARELRRGANGWADRNLLELLSGLGGDSMYHAPNTGRGLTLISLWSVLLRFIVPFIVLAIFLQKIGINIGL